MSVAVYAAKFEELSRFCPYINVEDAMVSKCVRANIRDEHRYEETLIKLG